MSRLHQTQEGDVLMLPELMGNTQPEINMKLYAIKMLKKQIKDIQDSLPDGESR